MVERCMTHALVSCTHLTDDQLLARVETLAAHERVSTATLIAALAELDVRRLYLREGYSSLFAYCTKALHLSEDATYNRIRAARVAAKWPIALGMIADGSLSVTTVRLLSDELTDANHNELLRAARHNSKRDVERIIATLRPRPAVAPSIRKVAMSDAESANAQPLSAPLLAPTAASLGHEGAPDIPPKPVPPGKRATVAPLAAEQYKIQFTIAKATHDKLRRVQDLMRHTNPTGDPAVIFDRALTLLLEQLERTKLGQARRPRQSGATRSETRHVPAAVKREVWARDGGRCAFVGEAVRCSETGFLEYHHVVPFADGGEASAANIQLRCRAHNAYEGDKWFGALIVRERHG